MRVVLVALFLGNAAIVAEAALRVRAGEPEVERVPVADCYHEEHAIGEDGGAQGKSYRGMTSTTVSGRTCQKWTDVKPHSGTENFKSEPDTVEVEDDMEFKVWGNGVGNHNYCRNPDQSMDEPWCYTSDPNPEFEKEPCNIPKCPTDPRDYLSEADELGTKVALGLYCDCADQLYGSTKTTADTAVSLVQ